MSNTDITPAASTDLLKAVQLTAMNVNGISEQMGLALNKINQNTDRIVALEDRLTSHERKETINSAQSRRIRKAVISRVNYLLKIKFKDGRVADESVMDDVRYRGGFIARLYSDAKSHSKMADSYRDTLSIDFDEVLTYIGSWEPEVDGAVDGYKRYLDIRREEREKKSSQS